MKEKWFQIRLGCSIGLVARNYSVDGLEFGFKTFLGMILFCPLDLEE
jgi:hypothetical protein